MQTANQIKDLSIDALQSNSEIEVFSISNILTNYIQYVKFNLDRIATSPSSTEGNITRIQKLLDLAQASTSNLTDGYYFLDKNGTVATYSEIDKGVFPNYEGINLSHRNYFEIPRQKGTSFISTVIDSNDNIPRIYFSTPILDINLTQRQRILDGKGSSEYVAPSDNIDSNNNQSAFKGVVVSAIAAEKLGNFLKSQIHPKFTGDIGFIDRNGTIINTSNRSFIGKNYFGDEFQSYLKSILKDKEEGFNNIINRAFVSESGVEQFHFENTSTTVAYEAVFTPKFSSLYNINNNNNNNNNRIGTLFITVPNTLAEDVISLINNQKITNFSIIVIIIAIATIAALVLLRWNRFLNEAVKLKTLQLSETVNKLRNANEELESSDKMQKEFINIAAHELRTPTQAITGNLELIEMIHLPSLFSDLSTGLPNVRQELGKLFDNNDSLKSFVSGLISTYRNSQRLEKLVNDILDTTRIESNRLQLHKEPFNLNQKIQNVIKDIHFKNKNNNNYISLTDAASKQVDILFTPIEDPIPVFADKIRIFEVISNLINNAIKFSNGQEIFITTKKISERDINKQRYTKDTDYISKAKEKHEDKKDEKNMFALVSIRDRGKGIDADIFPRLFTKFASKSNQGTGLGLYIAKSIVEAHGGIIWAQNNYDKGKGATFSFTLPLDNVS